jgi:hypothetical protein
MFQAVNATIERNTFYRNQTGTANGIFIHGTGSTGHVIQGNRLISSVGKTGASVICGFLVDSDFTDATAHIFRNNYISGTWERYIRCRRQTTIIGNIIDCRNAVTNAAAVESSHGTTLQVHGNTIINDGQTLYTIFINNTSSNSTIVFKNNIIHAVSGNHFYFGTGSAGCTFTADYNIYYGSTRTTAWNSATFANHKTATSQDLNSLNTDPLMVNVTSSDFRLQSGSPALNTAVVISGYNYRMALGFDVTRIATYAATTPSIGAYQT